MRQSGTALKYLEEKVVSQNRADKRYEEVRINPSNYVCLYMYGFGMKHRHCNDILFAYFGTSLLLHS